MELEFDKEMDALTRKAASRGVLAGVKPAGHLDADELAAFAENAMPEKTRSLHMAHLADCDRCRRILSGLIALNADAEPQTAGIAAPAIAASSEPWYRRFLLFPNLAYVMGGLVLIFGGLLTFSLLQSSQLNDSAAVSQTVETESVRGPAALEPAAGSAANAHANAANTNATSSDANLADSPLASAASNTAVAAAPLATPERAREEAPATTQSTPGNFAVDGVDAKPSVTTETAAPPPAPAAAAPPKEADLEVAKDTAVRKNEAKRSVAEQEKLDALSMKSRKVQDAPQTQAGGPAKAKPGPSREVQQNRSNSLDWSENRSVGGKNFQFRSGAWYDTAYRGQATTNVRRGTEDYRKLDGGLRSIAENLGGVVVVVWKDKAYRIQ